MQPKETKMPTESSTPSPVSQKRGADTPAMNAKAKVIKSSDSIAEKDEVAEGDEDVAEEEDRKSPEQAHAANQDKEEEEEEEEERNNGQIPLSWAEEAEAYRENSAKWERIEQPVEEALHRWCVKEYQQGTEVCITILAKQAAAIWTEMKPFLRPLKAPKPDRFSSHTGGWDHRMDKRVGMAKGGNMGEPRSAEYMINVDRHIKEIQHLLRGFRLEDIYSCMETAMYLRTTPYSHGEGAGNASSDRVTGVVQTPRVSILLCANATGEDKRKLSVFCKSRTFYLRKATVRDINVALTDTGFMTARVFSYWLQQFDRDMGQQGRYIALMYDNTPITFGCENLQLRNIALVRLPSSTKFDKQPLGFLVDRFFKLHYCKDMLEATMPELADVAPSVPEADLWPLLATSWDKVEPSCIRMGFSGSCIMTADRSRELDAFGPEYDGCAYKLQEDLEDRYSNGWVELLVRYQALDYIDILFSKGPNALTSEAVRETLDSGEYNDLFFDRSKEVIVVGDGGVVVVDAPLPASEKPVIEEERWGADDKERFLSCLEKLSGFGTGMMRDKIRATPELKKQLFEIHQALESLTSSIEREQ